MTAFDIAGLVGDALILGSYGAAQAGRLDVRRPLSLSLNALGAGLIIVSMIRAFNLPAFIVEAAWALIALGGIARYALRSRR